MLSSALDIFRLRQYFNAITAARELLDGVREDAAFLNDTRRAVAPLFFEQHEPPDLRPFPPARPFPLPGLEGKRLALVSTGGSGALASVVGAARALEEAGVRPDVISLCSGSSLFGFPIAAGIPAEEVAAFTISLQPQEYVDVDWREVASIVPKRGQGFGGLLRGEGIERAYRRLLGDLRLGDLAIPAYAPVWNVEENRLEYLGPQTYPDLPVARAVHMAIALPLFIRPVEFDGGFFCDGGIVDIFPVRPVLDIEPACDVALAVNGFYPPRFAGEDASGWHDRRGSIFYLASQVRTCQQVELARANLRRLERRLVVHMIEPVPYETVRGVGFYRQFMNTTEWGDFMLAGRAETRRVLEGAYGASAGRRTRRSATGRAAVRGAADHRSAA